MGPFAGYADERASTCSACCASTEAAAAQIDEELVPSRPALRRPGALGRGDRAAASCTASATRRRRVLAPTGTIGLMMDCDTTGIEPDLGARARSRSSSAAARCRSSTRPCRGRSRGSATRPSRSTTIVAYIDEHKSIVGAPHLQPRALPVFACSMGDNTIHYMGHVRMMAAVQPFISGAISKTVNMPEEATVEEVEQLLRRAWKLGLKAVAIYRDNCKVAQPLSADKKKTARARRGRSAAPCSRSSRCAERLPQCRAPRSRRSSSGWPTAKGYITVGRVPRRRPRRDLPEDLEAGLDPLGRSWTPSPSRSRSACSTACRWRPTSRSSSTCGSSRAGMTDDPDIRFATSLVDYVFRRLALDYLPEERARGARHPLDRGAAEGRQPRRQEKVGQLPRAREPSPKTPSPDPADRHGRAAEREGSWTRRSATRAARRCSRPARATSAGRCGSTSGCS